MTNNNTTRFSNRVDNYVKYRPHYPSAIVDFLQEKHQLSPDKTVADIGSGTGISSLLFLDKGYRVTGIEPNKEMREKSEELLKDYSNFKTTSGTAENTLLGNASIDAILSGQAFHWFDKEKCSKEFERILQPNGLVILIWNERLVASDFEKEYDKLIIQYASNYVSIDHRNISDKDIEAFCQPHKVELTVFPNKQVFDFDGLKGRLLSSSYMPTENEKGFDEMITDLHTLFNKFQNNSTIEILYDTKVYVSKY